MRKGPIGWVVLAVALLGVATIWGLVVSVGVSGPAYKRADLPDAGFDNNVGRSATVVTARWGSGQGQVGLLDQPEPKGPNSFGVDDRGRVYVLDEVNRRVVRYAAGRQDALYHLPDTQFDDLVTARDRFVVLNRDEPARRALVFDAEGGLVATLPVDANVGGITRLFVVGPDVCVECSNTALFKIGTLDGAAASAADQAAAMPGRPTPAGTVLGASLQDRNDVAVDVKGPSHTTTIKLRAHSNRDIAGIVDMAGDKAGSIYAVYGLYKEDPANVDNAKGRLVIAKYSANGELIGRAETRNDYRPEPFRKVAVTESGDVYQLTTGRAGIAILKWTLDR